MVAKGYPPPKKTTTKKNDTTNYMHISLNHPLAQSTGVVEYIDCTATKG